MIEAVGRNIYEKVNGEWRWVSKEEDYYFVEDKDGKDGVGLWGERLRKVTGRRGIDPYHRSFEQDLSPLWRYCLREKPELDLNKHILYFDIEVEVSRTSELQDYSKEIVSVALTTNRAPYSVVIIRTDKEFEIENARVVRVSSEWELLQKYLKYIRYFKPDIVTGWFSNRFDIPYLIERSKRYNLDILAEMSPFRIATFHNRRHTKRGTGSSGYQVSGIELLDLKDVYVFVVWRPMVGLALEEVAQYHLGVGKLEIGGRNIKRLLEADPLKLARYNIQDVNLLKELDRVLPLVPNLAERQRYAPLPLRELMSNSRVIDYLYIEEAHARNLRVPSRARGASAGWSNHERRDSQVSGGLVMQPSAGVWTKVAVLDFKSMYPSIIVQENLSPEPHRQSELGILPVIVQRLMELRKKYKSMKQTEDLRRRDIAIKGLINSTFGVVGFRGFRLWDPNIVESITSTGRQLLTDTTKFLNSIGYEVIYGDTDSLFIPRVEDPEGLMAHVNDFLGGRFETDLNYYFKRLVLLGKKKRWIGLKEDGSLEVRGIVTVRRDMPLALRKYLSEAVYHLVSGKLSEFKRIKEQVMTIDPSTLPLSELTERTNLSKGNPNTYWARAAKNAANIFGYQYMVGEEVPWVFIKDPKLEVIAIPPDLSDEELLSRWRIDWQRIVERWFTSPLQDLERVLIAPQRKLGDFE